MKRKDIRLGAEDDMLEFVDGYRAVIKGAVIVIKDGVDWVKYYLLPTDELAKRYDITRDQLDENLCLEKEYPKDMIIILNEDDPARKTKFCFLNYEGHETPTSKKFRGIITERREIMELKKELDKVKAHNAFLSEQNFIAQTNVLKYVKQNFGQFADVFGPMMRSIGRIETEETKATGKGGV